MSIAYFSNAKDPLLHMSIAYFSNAKDPLLHMSIAYFSNAKDPNYHAKDPLQMLKQDNSRFDVVTKC
jgi:hypothetical protein